LNGGNKWRVWMDAGVHAREWLAPATAIYIADQVIIHRDFSLLHVGLLFKLFSLVKVYS